MGSDTFEILHKIHSLSQHVTELHAVYKDVHRRLDQCIDNPDHNPKECQELFNRLATVTRDIRDVSEDLLSAVEEYHGLIYIRSKRH